MCNHSHTPPLNMHVCMQTDQRSHTHTRRDSQSVLLMSTFCSQLSSAHRQASYWIRGTGLNKTGRLSLSISSQPPTYMASTEKIQEIEGLRMSTRRDNMYGFLFFCCSALFICKKNKQKNKKTKKNKTPAKHRNSMAVCVCCGLKLL